MGYLNISQNEFVLKHQFTTEKQAKLLGVAAWKSFLESGEMHLQVLRELAEDMARLQSSCLRSHGSSVKVPLTGKRGI